MPQRRGYREGRKVKTRTLSNLAAWPPGKIQALRRMPADEQILSVVYEGGHESGAFEIERSLPHGHVAAVSGTPRRPGLDRMIASRPGRTLAALARHKKALKALVCDIRTLGAGWKLSA